MTKLRRKGFTLIELIAVLVIIAILAIIVTPLVMNIIRKAKLAADKRSIDAYGRSIELAIAGYLLDNGKFPTDVSQLTIEYSGNKVECSTTQLNSDSSVYLTGCTVGGRTVDYTYGTDKAPSYRAYSVGDEITYNGVDYYVIKDSGVKESTVTLLKAEPLTVAEVINYKTTAGIGLSSTVTVSYAEDVNGYGGMHFDYSSNVYSNSDIKKVIDLWKVANAPDATEVRLITKQELITNLGYVLMENASGEQYTYTNVPSFVYNSNYWYWTSTPYSDSSSDVWRVDCIGRLDFVHNYPDDGVVRPVIVLPKNAI